MIRLKDRQQVTASQIDAVVSALNTNHINSKGLVDSGMQAIHQAILAAAKEKKSTT